MVSLTIATAFSVALIVTTSIPETKALKGGTSRTPCDYPGVAAIILQSIDLIFCHGIIQQETLKIPQVCYDLLLSQSASSAIDIRYGDGTKTHTIPAGSFSGQIDGGAFSVGVPGIDKTGVCNPDATLFDPNQHTLDEGSCELVSYGPNSPAPKAFDGNLNGASITKSTSAACCSQILDTYSESERGVSNIVGARNCLTSVGTPCGVSDFGAPIYCDTNAGDKVVIGLTVAVPCNDASPSVFTAHDLTGNSDDVKFGISI